MFKQVGVSHIGYMKIATPNQIASVRKAKGMTQQQLAEAVGSHWITISKLERGKMQLTSDWMERLSQALDVMDIQLLSHDKTLYRTVITARLLPEGVIENLPEDQPEFVTLHSDYFGKPWYIWYEVRDDALWPWFKSGDLVCAFDLGDQDPSDFLGRICRVISDSGEQVFGELERGDEDGRFTVRRSGQYPLRNIVIANIAPIAMAVYNVPIDAPQTHEDEDLYGPIARKI